MKGVQIGEQPKETVIPTTGKMVNWIVIVHELLAANQAV